MPLQREIFRLALERLRPHRWTVIVEIILWTVLAVYLGLVTTRHLPYFINHKVFKTCYWVIISLTPITIGALVYRAHFISGYGDEVLKTTPIPPLQVITPRMLAVLLTCLWLFLPIILLMFICHDFLNRDYVSAFDSRLLRAASGWLLSFPYKFPSQLEYECGWRLDDDGNFVISALMRLNHLERFAVIGLAALQFIGWLSLPITWGFYWRTRLQRDSGFWFAYFSYLVLPAIFAFINYQRLRLPPVGRVDPFYICEGNNAAWGFHQGWYDWLWMLLYGLGGVLLSGILFALTLRLWGRRKS